MEIESSLRKDLSEKIDKILEEKLNVKRQQDTELIKSQIKEMISVSLSPMKDLLQQTAIKQEQCMSRKRTKLLVKSCHVQLAQNMSRLEERLVSVISNVEKESASKSSVDKSSHELMLQSLKNEHDKVRDNLRSFVTKKEACEIAEDTSREQYERLMKASKEADQMNEAKVQSHLRDSSAQLRQYVTTEDVNATVDRSHEQYQRCMNRIDRIESKSDLCGALASRMKIISESLDKAVTREDVFSVAASKGNELRRNLVNEMDEFKLQLLRELDIFATKDEARAISKETCYNQHEKNLEQYMKHITDSGRDNLVKYLESRLNGIELDFDRKIINVLERHEAARNSEYSDEPRIQQDSVDHMRNGRISVNTNSDDDGSRLSATASNLDNALRETKELSCASKTVITEIHTPQRALAETSTIQPELHEHPIEIIRVSSTMFPLDASPVSVDSDNKLGMFSNLRCKSTDANKEHGKQHLILERNHTLQHVASTLSAVAAKRDDKLAAEMSAGCHTSKTCDTEKSDNDEDSPSKNTYSPCSVQSINTADALSLCGVQLDDHSYRLQEDEARVMPETLESNACIEAVEAISPWLLKAVSDQSSLMNGPDSVENCTAMSPHDRSSPLHDLEMYDCQEWNAEDELTLPGSIVSFDEEVKFKSDRSAMKYDPTKYTRVFNPEPYKGWDALLTQLKASGRVLRDSESTNRGRCDNETMK